MSPRRATGVRAHPSGVGWQARMMSDSRSLSRTFMHYEEAVAWRSSQVVRRGRGADPSSGRTLFGDHWDQWRAGLIRRPGTLARNDSAFRAYIGPRWRTPLDAITRAHCQEWVGELGAVGLAPATVGRVVRITATCVQAAVDDDVLERNPFRRLHLPEVPDEESRYLTVDEAHAIESAMDEHWSLVVPFAMDTGLRISELCGLQVGDVTFNRPAWVVHVRHIVTEESGRAVIGPPKTRAGIRVVPTLTPAVADRVAAHIAKRGLSPTDQLFSGPLGGIMRPVNWRGRVRRPAVDVSGIADPDEATPHSMRHGAVARWIEAGVVDPCRMACWLGHRSPATVTALYGHLIPEDTTWLTTRMAAESDAAAARARSGGVRKIG